MNHLEIPAGLDFPALWREAASWSEYATPAMKNWALWDGIHRHANIPGWAADAAARVTPLRLLVLSEDWCGDAANTVPVLARLAEAVPGVELRILARDRYPRVMDRYLTRGTRSIPIAIGLDRHWRELGHWGPRPAALQSWVLAHKDSMPKDQRYAETRRWYARDRGESTLRELLGAIGGLGR
jgi:hypothetical protein